MAEEDLARSEDSQDDELTKTINDRLVSDAGLDRKIQVHVSGREATLTGDVDSPEERDRAEAIAAAVSGVNYVINNLRVAQEGTTGATG
jgi:osmotically-inducible protein OsmY